MTIIINNNARQRAGVSPAHFKTSWMFAALSGSLFKTSRLCEHPRSKQAKDQRLEP